MPINSESTFLELVNDYHQKPEKFVFFVGAGLSQPLFPSWKTLLRKFVKCAKEGNLVHDEDELLRYIEDGKNYLDIADTCVSSMGSARYRDIMEEIFDKDFSESDIPESYKCLIDLSPKTIITTNYDRIPDIAGKGRYRIITNKNAPEGARFFSTEKNIVFKIHGDIIDQSSIVLTTSEYQDLINNTKTKSLLNSLLSTKVLIFVGFSLSDPHIDAMLNNIKSINNGIPISHYVLLNEMSSFKISSFEKKYGIRIISYTPTDHSHPEVIDFLRSLNHETSEKPEKIDKKIDKKITDIDELIKHIDEEVGETIIGSGVSVFYRNRDIYLSFIPTGETKGEIQKEILSIIRLMNFECEILDNLNIFVIAKTLPDIRVDKSQNILLKAKIKFLDAKRYSDRQISTSTLWRFVKFYNSASLSDLFKTEERVEFPMSTGIVGE